MSHYYLHIPFCRQKCPYCKFALTPVFDEFKKKRYIEYLKKEIREYFASATREEEAVQENNTEFLTSTGLLRSSQGLESNTIKTIYFGGGTPSVLSLEEVDDILGCFPGRDNDCEITFECNPEDITTEYIVGLFILGINRISIGVQSLNNETLKVIHRSDEMSILGALSSVQSAILLSGNTNDLVKGSQIELGASSCQNDKKSGISVNVDFILGLPYVKKGETLENIKRLHHICPYITHTSVYILEKGLYPKSWKNHTLEDPDLQEEFFHILEYFESIGWNHYEFSNWSYPGYESQHNQSYWNHSNYRGFGLSAGNYIDGKRWINSDSFAGYYKGIKSGEELLTLEQVEIEKLMFGLRTVDGYYMGDSILGLDQIKIQDFISKGFIVEKNNTIKLTKTGIFLIDYIMAELLI